MIINCPSITATSTSVLSRQPEQKQERKRKRLRTSSQLPGGVTCDIVDNGLINVIIIIIIGDFFGVSKLLEL